MNRVETFPIPDVQNFPDHRQLAINKVGFKLIRHPIAVRDKSGVQRTVAMFNLSVHLPHHLKGTHMPGSWRCWGRPGKSRSMASNRFCATSWHRSEPMVESSAAP